MYFISSIWFRIQRGLFPWLQERLGPLGEKEQSLVCILELARIEEFIARESAPTGRPAADRAAIARAFVTKAVFNLATTRQLLQVLGNSPGVRRICGWESLAAIPSEATFSRAFAEFSTSELPSRVPVARVKRYGETKLVGHLSRDSTDIPAREKPCGKSAAPAAARPKRRPGRPRRGEVVAPKEPSRLERQPTMTLAEMLADLPKPCDWGTKRDGNGHARFWKGFKLHLDCADGEIPIRAILTAASLHDSQVAIPLAKMSSERVSNLYDLMDSAYDAAAIDAFSRGLGHVPIIDSNPRRGAKKEMDAATARRYEERTTAERVNARLKDEFGGRTLRVRGAIKATAHLMFGLVALTADQLFRLLT